MSLPRLWLLGAYVGPLGVIGLIWFLGSSGTIPVIEEMAPLRPLAWPLAGMLVVIGALMAWGWRWFILRPSRLALMPVAEGQDGTEVRAKGGVLAVLSSVDAPAIILALFAVIVGRIEILGLAVAYVLVAGKLAEPDYDRLIADAGGARTGATGVRAAAPAGSVAPGDKPVSRKLWLALVVAIVLVAFFKVSNPHRVYSSSEYWRTATVESVAEIPEEALAPGNRNGSVLMWAAIASPDPDVVEALVARGADVNESDPWFDGTPLTGAAGKSAHPEMIDALIRLGADVNKRVNNDEDALMVAARFNRTPGIAERLLANGADPKARNAQGRTALDLANEAGNTVVARALSEWAKLR